MTRSSLFSMLHPESIDLLAISSSLARAFRRHPPQGYLRGKTVMRDYLEQAFGYSALDAEQLVDMLEAQGFLRFASSPELRSQADTPWAIDSGSGV